MKGENYGKLTNIYRPCHHARLPCDRISLDNNHGRWIQIAKIYSDHDGDPWRSTLDPGHAPDHTGGRADGHGERSGIDWSL